MKKVILTALSCLSFITISHASEAKTYQIAAYKNCELVLVIPMNEEQNRAYLELNNVEQRMDYEKEPLHMFEAQMAILGEQMEEITSGAVIENGDLVTINKALMKEQEVLAEQMQALVKEYQPEFTRLEKMGQDIGNAAAQFQTSLPAEIQDDEFDFVDILPLSEIPKDRYCGYKN
ncbi:MAG: hypothetical protein ACFHVJ_00805 [Aestuariibacter sp.]